MHHIHDSDLNSRDRMGTEVSIIRRLAIHLNLAGRRGGDTQGNQQAKERNCRPAVGHPYQLYRGSE